MELPNSAEDLQNYLVEMGYLYIEFCDIENDDPVEIYHYSLSKKDEPLKPESCLLYEAIDLKSDKALRVLQSWMSQIRIHPDPRTIKPEPAPLFPNLFNKLKNK
jgi:hypothetical protein